MGIKAKICIRKRSKVVDEFASGVSFEQGQMVEWLPSADQRRLQSPSAAVSPKQDRCERLSARHSEDSAGGTVGAVAKAGSSEGCGVLASNGKGLGFERDGDI